MELSEVIRRRRMVRNYDPDRPVPAEAVERLLGYATHAPSAGFSQGWEFLLLDTPGDVERFWTVTTPEEQPPTGWMEGMTKAPVIVVPLSHRDAYLDRYAQPDKGWTDRDEARWPVPYWHIDTGMASLLVLLGAVDEGLGACFFGITPDRIPQFRVEFGVPEAYTPIGAMTIGFRAQDKKSPSLKRGRRESPSVTHRGNWGNRPVS
ncbi:nitroreductase family protein [Dactylosporangium sp. NPDC049140]|uniref:nitroreductase family protein n=1 Tax=Dactylosporangium sp. NPDC049140 TaxID=3155647 RepID=UPI003409DB44